MNTVFTEREKVIVPSTWGRARLMIAHVSFAALMVAGTVFMLLEYSPLSYPLIALAGVAVAVLAFLLIRAGFRYYTFTLYDDRVVVSRGRKEKVYPLDDFYIIAHTTTTYVNAIIPVTTRSMIVRPKVEEKGKRDIQVAMFGYGKKDFARLLNATTRQRELREREEYNAYLEQHPELAVTPESPVVRGLEGQVDSSLNPEATYAIVTSAEDLAENKYGTAIFALVGGAILAVWAYLIISESLLIFGIILFVLGLVRLLRGGRQSSKKNTMLGAEFTPQALTISVRGNTVTYPWQSIRKIELTPTGYRSSSGSRKINIHTDEGVQQFFYGLENNEKLDENFYWFTEYAKLHALDRIEYLYR